MTMREYARGHARNLLARVEAAAELDVDTRDAEGVRELRVSLRRLIEFLRVFNNLFDAKGARKPIKRLMSAAAEVRDRDIALVLLKDARIRAPMVAETLQAERIEANERLKAALLKWRRKQVFDGLRRDLEL